MFTLSKRSSAKLKTCHHDLIIIIEAAMATTLVDFGVSQGERTFEEQQEYFKAGKSKIDGITAKSKHQHSPSLAVDIYAYYGGAKWDDIHMAYLGGHIMTTATRLYKDKVISHRLRWGGNWDGDGTLVYDHTLKDLPHFELIIE